MPASRPCRDPKIRTGKGLPQAEIEHKRETASLGQRASNGLVGAATAPEGDPWGPPRAPRVHSFRWPCRIFGPRTAGSPARCSPASSSSNSASLRSWSPSTSGTSASSMRWRAATGAPDFLRRSSGGLGRQEHESPDAAQLHSCDCLVDQADHHRGGPSAVRAEQAAGDGADRDLSARAESPQDGADRRRGSRAARIAAALRSSRGNWTKLVNRQSGLVGLSPATRAVDGTS